MKKNICFIFVNNGLGGSANVALQNIILASKEYNVSVITNKINYNYFKNYLNRLPIKIGFIKSEMDIKGKLKLLTPILKHFYSFDRKATRTLQLLIQLNKPDIIHLHSTIALNYFFPKDFPKIKKIFTLHETGGLIPELNHFYNFGQTFSENLVKIRKFDYVTCASENVLNSVRQLTTSHKCKLICIRNGISNVQSNSKSFQKINALFVGGALPVKNIYFFIHILEQIGLKTLKSINFQLNILGYFDQNLRDYITASPVSTIIRLEGLVNQALYLEYLSTCNVYVNTSFHETVPNSLMDAIDFGLVPILSNSGGNLELFGDSKNYICLNYLENIPNDLISILRNEEYLNQIVRNNLELKHKFTWPIIYQSYNKIYKL